MLRPTALVLSLITALPLAGCSSSGGSTAAPKAATPSTAAASTALSIASFRYDPTPLTVSPGATVPVTNSDSAEHTVSSDTTGLFLADDVAHGKTVTFRAPTKPGTYTFHCEYHASMHGTLVVR